MFCLYPTPREHSVPRSLNHASKGLRVPCKVLLYLAERTVRLMLGYSIGTGNRKYDTKTPEISLPSVGVPRADHHVRPRIEPPRSASFDPAGDDKLFPVFCSLFFFPQELSLGSRISS